MTGLSPEEEAVVTVMRKLVRMRWEHAQVRILAKQEPWNRGHKEQAARLGAEVVHWQNQLQTVVAAATAPNQWKGDHARSCS